MSIGHIHLIAPRPEELKNLWIDVLGAQAATLGELTGVRAGAVYIWIDKGEPAGGSEGSAIRDIGFQVRDLDTVLKHAGRDGFLARQASRSSAQLLTPEKVLLELTALPTMQDALRFDHLHLVVPDAGVARVWYQEQFGDSIQGTRFIFISAGTTALPTKGRALDHVGLEVAEFESFAARLKTMESGIGLEGSNGVMLTDPWGVRIEIREKRQPGL